MPPATYAVSTTQTSVDEGGTVTWDVVTTNVPDGTTLYYMTEGTGAGDVTPADTTGSFIITNNAGSFTQTLIEDGTTDGTVTFRVKIRTGLRGGRNLAFSQTIPVNDTSQPPTYQTLVSNVDTVDEGGNFTITLTTVQIADNTTVPYTISGVDSADINGAPLTGNFTVNNNTASANFTVSLDSAVEGMETFTLAISDAIGTISVNVAINDGPTIRTVTVASGTNIYGTGNKYYFAELGASAGQIISLNEEVTYRFDQSDSSNSNHQLLFSTTANGTHGGGVEYTAGVTKVGTAGTAGAYTQITVPAGAPTLHYYCINHANMGNVANTPVSNYQYINSSFETMFN